MKSLFVKYENNGGLVDGTFAVTVGKEVIVPEAIVFVLGTGKMVEYENKPYPFEDWNGNSIPWEGEIQIRKNFVQSTVPYLKEKEPYACEPRHYNLVITENLAGLSMTSTEVWKNPDGIPSAYFRIYEARNMGLKFYVRAGKPASDLYGMRSSLRNAVYSIPADTAQPDTFENTGKILARVRAVVKELEPLQEKIEARERYFNDPLWDSTRKEDDVFLAEHRLPEGMVVAENGVDEGDFVKCHACGSRILIHKCSDTCCVCRSDGTNSWADERQEEWHVSDLRAKGYIVVGQDSPEAGLLKRITYDRSDGMK